MDPIPLSVSVPTPLQLRRREFLKGIGAGALALPAIAGPFVRAASGANGGAQDGAKSPGGLSPDHFVPLDKKLDKKWIAALTAKGQPTIYSGEHRAACAMPVGGIGCGQLYVGGDGTLRLWQIFNRRDFSGWGQHNYELAKLPRIIEHGFAVAVKRSDGSWKVKRLREEDFPDVTMKGQHPIAEFTYPASDGGADPFHVETKLEVFAPFIPGNSADSTLPATFFRVKLRATVPGVTAVLLSWMENFAAPDSGELFGGTRSFEVRNAGAALAIGAVCEVKAPAKPAAPPEVFADFEGGDYGAWKVEGEAFGKGPSHGTEPNQNPVSGFLGKGLVNTYRPDDRPTGKLTSPKFKIGRRYVNFLIAGGKTKETALRLVIDGDVVATASGQESEALAWAHFDCEKWQGREATLEIVDASSAGWGHVNVDQIEFGDAPKIGNGGTFESQADVGTLYWMAFPRDATAIEEFAGSLEGAAAAAVAATADERRAALGSGPNFWTALPNRPVALFTIPVKATFDQAQEFDFALAWYCPNAAEGNWYAARFGDGNALTDYVANEAPRLTAATRAWHDAYYSGSLPHWLLERLHAPVANLQTNVTQVWKSGRFWAWEGVGCCEGTCTHVWNYEHATGRMFPQLARSTREMQDLGAGFHEDGLVGYRGIDVYAADGQCGTVLKCYREHQMSADDQFLKRNWPKIKKVVEYLLKRDGNDDGLLEDDQHNTYDIQFFGPNTFVGSLYLAALRAAEQMARLMNDGEFALRCRKVFDLGTKLTSEKLWNGEYFIQQVDLKAHPKDQYADGCLADQLFGQGWARQLGLGDLYPKEQVKRALQSVWNYCWAPDCGPQMVKHTPERYFARQGEAGLFICTWPKSAHLGDNGVRYRDEVWTGIEYQVAGHMVWEGMLTEGLAIVRGIHERYDGRVHNPWNEIECGDHYARAMASVGVYLALLGFEFDGPAGVLGFAPALTPEDFTAAFPTPDSFGTVRQKRQPGVQMVTVELATGRLPLREMHFAVPADWADVTVHAEGSVPPEPRTPLVKPIATQLARKGPGFVAIRFTDPVELIGPPSKPGGHVDGTTSLRITLVKKA